MDIRVLCISIERVSAGGDHRHSNRTLEYKNPADLLPPTKKPKNQKQPKTNQKPRNNNMQSSSVRFLPPSAEAKTHHRFPSISNINPENLYKERLSPIPRPSSTHLDNLPQRYPTLSHDSSSRHTNHRNPIDHTHLHPSHHHHHHPHSTHHHQQYHHHQDRHLSSEKPRPSSISKIPNHPPPSQQQQALRPSISRTRTQSLTEASLKPTSSSSSSITAHQRSWIVPLNSLHPRPPASRTPSPSPGSSALAKNSITSIKKNLVEILDRFACPLEDKLLLVAKLHAEVEAELTQLSELSVGPTYTTHNSRSSRHAHHESVDRSANHKKGQTQTGQQNHSRKEIEDMVRLIKHADRIKAHALQQLKQDLSNSHSQSDPHPDPYTRPLHPPSVHTSNNSGRVALLNRTDLH
ncbi:hypothetical protein PGT21_018133 [Puccinia graminis f. sp. tritici]|uniref:Uncharacterized protein n=1 Tax=Puccinia graminis f. sp. tritici TaxID=56615 RepID=A0A5B0NLP8_PUCGR|nr:hypothetical protein PGT21_018133 [Puccinia graminis f. sp. tritici]